MIFRLLYASRSRIEPDRVAPELGRILAQARKYNRNHGITAALVHSGAYFAQIVEGPRQDVLRLETRIMRDPRHEAARRLRETVAPNRLLDGWPMVLIGEAHQLEPHLAALHALDVDEASSAALEKLILGLVAAGGRWPTDDPSDAPPG